MGKLPLIGLFGGMFDPIHQGHLHVATSLIKKIDLDHIRLIPCHHPNHRKAAIASNSQRLEMIKLAIKPYHPKLVVDDCEINHSGISYTATTLLDLQQRLQAIYCLIIGIDAFISFRQWHNWQAILKQAHIIVVNRPDYDDCATIIQRNQLSDKQINDTNLLHHQQAGAIYHCPIQGLKLASSSIRDKLLKGQLASLTQALAPAVMAFINQHQCYRS